MTVDRPKQQESSDAVVSEGQSVLTEPTLMVSLPLTPTRSIAPSATDGVRDFIKNNMEYG